MKVVFYLEGYESVAGKGVVAKINSEIIPEKEQIWYFYNDIYDQIEIVLLVEKIVVKYVNNEFDSVIAYCSRIQK